MWKDIKGCEGLYEVSDSGLVRNKVTKHILVGDVATYDIKNELSKIIGISSVMIKNWLHGKHKSYTKYGIKSINYL